MSQPTHCFFLIFLFFITAKTSAQQRTEKPILYLDKTMPDSIHLLKYTDYFVDSTNLMLLQSVKNQNFTPLSNWDIPSKGIHSRSTYWLRTDLQNTDAQDTLYLSYNLDLLLDSITIFILENHQFKDSIRIGRFIRPHPQIEKVDFPSNRTVLIKLPPFRRNLQSVHCTVFAKIQSLSINKNLRPILFRIDKEIRYFIWDIMPIYAWHLCFLSILGFMALLTFGSYIQYKHAAYLFYGLYIVAHFVTYLRDFESYEQFHYRLPTLFFSIYYRAPVSFTANIFYALFTMSFLGAKQNYPKIYRYGLIFLVYYLVFMVTERIWVFYDFWTATLLTDYFAMLNSFAGLFLLLYVAWSLRKNILARYLLVGSIFYVIGIVASRVTIMTSPLWDDSLIWNQLGILIELLFFWFGLAYKARFDAGEKERLRLENQVLAIEKERTVSLLRNQIAQDIHDEIGSGLTKISLNAQVATRLSDLTADEFRERLSKIDNDARILGSQMREVIFAINPEYDNFDDLQAYFKEYARDFWAESGIEPVFDFEKSNSNPLVSPQIKRQLLLIFKEAQNNAAKYAQATDIHITLKINEINQFLLEIQDNGKGFEADKLKGFSKGLSGMKQRAASIDAILTIESQIGKGTTVKVIGQLS